MDTFMNNDAQASGFGEYPVTSSLKISKTSNPPTTEGFTQFQQTTNATGFDAQMQEFPNIENLENEDFASVNEIQSNGAATNVQFDQFAASANANADFGGFQATTTTTTTTNNVVDTNAFTENTTSNMDFGANAESQFSEYQATSPIIDTAETAQILQNANTNYENVESFGATTTTTENVVDTGATYNDETFQSVEPSVDLGNITTSTPATETNNFDFTATDSIVGATSALNNFDSTNYMPSEPAVETTNTNFEVNNIDFTASTPAVDTSANFDVNAFTTTATTTTTTTTNVDLTHELVDPNPIPTNKNFALDQPTSFNEYQSTQPAIDTTNTVDLNAFAATATTTEPTFDATAFTTTTQSEPIVETNTQNVDLNAFAATATTESTAMPTFDTTAFTTTQAEATPSFDATAVTTTQQETTTTTQNFDLNAFTSPQPTFDATAFTTTQPEPVVETTPAFDATAFTTTQPEPVVDTTPAFDATAFTTTQQETTTQNFDINAFTTTQPEPVVDTTHTSFRCNCFYHNST